MSNAEEIAKEIAEKKVISSAGVKTWERMIKEAMQAHTNQALQDLKDPSKIREITMREYFEHIKIKDDMGFTGEWRMSNKDVLDVLITLIDEAINE